MPIGFLFIVACQKKESLYKYEFSDEEKLQFAKNFISGLGNYYQGSESWQFLLKDAKMLAPEIAEVHRELGIPPLKRGIISQFYAPYERAVQLDAVSWQGWRGYLFLYFYRDYDRAIKDFDELDPLTPDFVDYPQSQSIDFMRGVAYLMKDDYQKALEYFDKHFEYDKNAFGIDYMDIRNFLYKGITHLKRGELDAANTIFDLGLKYNPRSPDLAYWKAILMQQMETGQKQILPFLDIIKTNFDYRISRSYTEQFFQLYWSDVEQLEKSLLE